jgi:cytochrome c6
MKKIYLYALALSVAASFTPKMFAASPASATYSAKCAMCHGADGKGNTPVGKALKVPDYKSPEVLKLTDAQLVASITGGKGKMPAFGSRLSGAEIQGLAKYVRTLQKK